MRVFKLKRTRSRVNQKPRYPLYALAALLLAAAVALTVTGIAKGRTESALSHTRARLSERTQQEINLALRAYDRISVPGVDVRADVLPVMRQNLYAANVVNQTLSDSYGADHAVVTPQAIDAVSDAIDQLDAAILAGLTGSTEREQLKAAVLAIETEMNERLAGSGLYQTKSALM